MRVSFASIQYAERRRVCQVDDDGESYWVFESRDVRTSSVPLLTLTRVDGTALSPAFSASESRRLAVSHAQFILPFTLCTH